MTHIQTDRQTDRQTQTDFIICPIAICYSYRQIIKCVCTWYAFTLVERFRIAQRLDLCFCQIYFYFYSAAALLAMQSAVITMAFRLSVRLSVRPSVTGWYGIQTNEDTCRIMWSSLWGSKKTLIFWYQQRLRGDVPFYLKFALRVTHAL